MADGAYDGAPTYATIASDHGKDIEVVIPPRWTAVTTGEQGPLAQRDRHLEVIREQGRMAWQRPTDYGERSLIETTMGRHKAPVGPRLGARGFPARQNEAAIGVVVSKQMLAAGRSFRARHSAVRLGVSSSSVPVVHHRPQTDARRALVCAFN
jgi:hypothetical protein